MKKYFFIFFLILFVGILFFGFGQKIKAALPSPSQDLNCKALSSALSENGAANLCSSETIWPLPTELKKEGSLFYCCKTSGNPYYKAPSPVPEPAPALPSAPVPTVFATINSINPTKGQVQTVIEIIGTNFHPVCDKNLVRFEQIDEKGETHSYKPTDCPQSGSVLKSAVPSFAGPGSLIKVTIHNSVGLSNSKDFLIEGSPLRPGGATGAKAGGLQVKWPTSPLGKELDENTNITRLVEYFYGWGISLGGFAAFIALVIAGVQYLTSAGNPGKMSEAMARIRSAAIGLVLLLSSVLILNTINPQLTQLKMPPLPVQPQTITLPEVKFNLPNDKPCGGAELFSGANYNTMVENFGGKSEGEISKGSSFVVRSVRFQNGACQVKLYQQKDFEENADEPAISVSSDIADITNLGATKFRSARLINLYYKND